MHSLEIELEEKTKPIKIIQVRKAVAQQAHTYELTHDTKEEKYSVFILNPNKSNCIYQHKRPSTIEKFKYLNGIEHVAQRDYNAQHLSPILK